MICNYFLQVCKSSSHAHSSVSHRVKACNFYSVQVFNLLAFGIISENSSPSPRSYRICIIHYRCSFIFSSRNVMILHFTFKSMIHLISCLCKILCMNWGLFNFLHMDLWLFWYHLLNRQFFLHWVAFVNLSNISILYLCGVVSGLSFLFHWPIHTSIISLLPHYWLM